MVKINGSFQNSYPTGSVRTSPLNVCIIISGMVIVKIYPSCVWRTCFNIKLPFESLRALIFLDVPI